MFLLLYADDKLLLSEAFYFKLAWIINMIMTFMIWGPIWLLWWLVFFLRLTIFNSFFMAGVKFGLAGPLFCYEAVLVLFILALVLDNHYPSSQISMVEGSLNMAAVLVVHAFTGFV